MVPAHPLTRLGVVIVIALAVAGCGGDGRSPDPQAFCAEIESLRADDPFAELLVASPGEMRDAFAELRAGAGRIADAAPSEVEVQARRYRDAVDDLVDQLNAAGYDPRTVDALAYRDATETYSAAASSLDNAADATCS